MTHISVVIPLYNEEGCLERNFGIIKEHLISLGKPYEIILVNDGSLDRTGDIVNMLVRENPCTSSLHNLHNRGKGVAVKKGMLHASGGFILFLDADLAVPAQFIGTCLRQLESGSAVVIGSRHLPESCFKIRQGFARQFLGEIFRRGVKLFLGLHVTDVTCGLKGFERRAAIEIFSRSRVERWGYDAEILFLARKLGYQIRELPVVWYHSFDSKVRIFSAAVNTLIEVFKIYYCFLTNRYGL